MDSCTAEHNTFMRYASPNEQRLISKEYLGWYKSINIGAVYDFGPDCPDLRQSRSYLTPLMSCAEAHPFLCVIVRDSHTEKSFYERVASLDLAEHVRVAEDMLVSTDDPSSESEAIERVLASDLDRPWPLNRPLWSINVYPIVSAQNASPTRCFINFAYAHSLGDGMAGPAFHRTFLRAIQLLPMGKDAPATIKPNQMLSPPFDTAERFTIAWGFLLGPLMALLLPKFLANWLGFRASATTVDEGTWIGAPIFFDSKSFRSHVRILEIDAAVVHQSIKICRKHNTKFTGLFHQLIVRALSRAVTDEKVTNFVSGSAVSMRQAVGVSEDEMGCFVIGYNDVHPRTADADDGPLSDIAWRQASTMTQKLAESAVQLHNQPIGLLRFVPSIKNYLTAKIGKTRDWSYEVSNLRAFTSPSDNGDNKNKNKNKNSACRITKMVFAQPASVVQPPLVFSIVSVKGGSLMCVATWQHGALGQIPTGEDKFVAQVLDSIKAGLKSLE
ncbi:hypothetical protein BX600DRAFT_485081 [Xylariales sp. PMI_506]|nr:hypothetical protein BX600DRAFT_485081 [Xylariales sp. PMI_506]